MATKPSSEALCLYAHLDRITPPIWRRLLVPPDLSLHELHLVLQAAFGWDDSHLHDFRQGKGKGRRMVALPAAQEVDFPSPDVDLPGEEDVTVADVLKRPGSSLTYVYDYGDHWEHIIRLEERRPAVGNLPRCLEAERAGPPEDCGGVPGYYELLDAFKEHDADPKHAQRVEGWHPERVDIEGVNERMGDFLSESSTTLSPTLRRLIELLDAPLGFGVPEDSVSRFDQFAADFHAVSSNVSAVAGYLRASEIGITEGVLVFDDGEDFEGLPTMLLYESVRDFLGDTPGDAEPRRVGVVAFVPEDAIPAKDMGSRSGMVAVPAVLLPEGLEPPNHEELDVLAACLAALAESLGQWDTGEPLPPTVERTYEMGGRPVDLCLVPDADLELRDSYPEPGNAPLSLGFEQEDQEEDE